MREILEFERFVSARYNHKDLSAESKAIIDKQINDFLELEEYHKNRNGTNSTEGETQGGKS